MAKFSFKLIIILVSFFTTAVFSQDKPSATVPLATQDVIDFYSNVMLAEPFQPADTNSEIISTELPQRDNTNNYYTTSEMVDYFSPNWEQRISKDWQFFSAPKALGRILVINFSATSENNSSSLSYRYLANQNSQNELYEPWSSSKVLAYTAAVAKVRQMSDGKIGGQSKAGDTPIADLITSIHSYEPFGSANGDSNAIASYFVNVAGRDRITALFHDQWLMLANPAIRLRGAYDNKVFEPNDQNWQIKGQKIPVEYPTNNVAQLDYQSYRCEHCGLTGNKPMTTLAQAEWLKRLAVHDRDPLTRQPHLTAEDVQVLFFGTGHSDQNYRHGGMMQGISVMLHNALATAIAGTLPADPKKVLDDATQGQWRVWQKIGWGPSETRGAGENVLLAHISLPFYQGGMEFTVAAQTAEPGDGEIYVNYAGIKMQALLTQSLTELFAINQP